MSQQTATVDKRPAHQGANRMNERQGAGHTPHGRPAGETARTAEPSVSVRELDIAFGAHKVISGLDLDVSPGEFIVLLGPSGCGKSTLLNAIAGLLDISDGEIWIDGKNVTWAEPKDRGIGMVFQSYALYPRMSVEKNLSFGLRISKLPKAEIDGRVARVAELLQLDGLLKRRPSELSGGQRQRVAIGRALVRNVDVFLFDEPLSNLDAKLRNELRVEIKKLHQRLGNTMIYVTHDQIEAMTLADRIAVMRGGVIQQLGPPKEIYRKPVNRFVASFIGSPSMNFFEGELRGSADGSAGSSPDGPAFAPGGSGAAPSIPLARYDFIERAPSKSRPAVFGIRPEHIALGDQPDGHFSAEGKVDLVEAMGADTIVWTSLAGVPLTIRTDGETEIRPGETIRFGFDPASACLFDAATDLRL
ncbi:ABC transporter ATP-binding protein [Aurantimonas sp. 22II-16-19i]|uniref:ABC transporter ATP-binding protein n=1 Tax=Aurantimonas sp. 22II-16-19i TaxID=1317114 RepID=UPI0009F7D96C|nr:ABC transporter ATP-binding protein [Aurantimonas sp. 22II-16-19i]ORE98397.1 sugar ABC transporter ATP-binding protein [Aurantimonas sp. 22II-16-19i]